MKNTKYNKTHISSTQFFVLFCLCFFSPSTVFLPRLITNKAGTAGWIVPIVGLMVFVILLYMLGKVLSAEGDNWYSKSQNILGRPISIILSCMVLVWCVVLSAFFVRHFAERVVLVYLQDASVVFVVLSLLLVVVIACTSGMLSYARLCEILFYVFVVLFVGVTALAFFDGVNVHNLLPIVGDDWSGVFEGSLYMFLPFGIVVYMMFFADYVNFDSKKFLMQSVKSSLLVSLLSCAVLVLTIGQLGVFGVQYLQLPYFSITRQIAILGPLKNIGSIVFSLWILADFALVATLAYTSTSVAQRLLGNQRRNMHVYVVVAIVAIVAIFVWRDMLQLDQFLSNVIMPLSVVSSVGIPLLLFVVGVVRRRITFGNGGKNKVKRDLPITPNTQI